MADEQSFRTIGGDGSQSVVTEPSEVAELEQASENFAKAEDKRVADAQSVLAMLAPKEDDLAVEKVLEVNGQQTTFYIKRLTHTEVQRLDAKKYRRQTNGQIVRDLELEETVAVAWLISTAVVTNIAKEGAAPNWAPLWKPEEILGGKQPGLMQNPNPAAQELLYSLQAAIWDVNPPTNPILAATALSQLGMA